MLTGFIVFCHAVVCIFLISIILLQSGRGGGLTESFASAGDMFGAQTNTFLVKGTSILATLFLVTCLGLAFISARKSDSLMAGKVVSAVEPVTTKEVVAVVADDSVVETLGETAEDTLAENPETLPAN